MFIVVTGGFRSAKGMNEALASGATDLIGLARPLAVEPDLPHKAINDATYQIALRELTTGFRKLDNMVFLNVSWYEAQLSRLGRGKRLMFISANGRQLFKSSGSWEFSHSESVAPSIFPLRH